MHGCLCIHIDEDEHKNTILTYIHTYTRTLAPYSSILREASKLVEHTWKTRQSHTNNMKPEARSKEIVALMCQCHSNYSLLPLVRCCLIHVRTVSPSSSLISATHGILHLYGHPIIQWHHNRYSISFVRYILFVGSILANYTYQTNI